MHNKLSEGHVGKRLILFAMPFLFSNIIQSLYNVVDMIVVGQFAGTAGLSGVNIAGQITFNITNFVLGLCAGGTILVAQYIGAKKEQDVQQTISTMFTMLIVSAIIITILVLGFNDQLLQLIQTPVESFQEATNYLRTTALGIIFIFGYNAVSAIMRGTGDSKTPLRFITIACVINIILDLIFVGYFKIGALGAAIATVMSQAISLLLCINHLRKNNFIFHFHFKNFVIYKDQLKKILKLGIPMSIQNIITGLSFIILTALVNQIGGMEASAAVGSVSKLNAFGIMPAVAMSMALSTMAAQNIGAKRIDRALEATKYAIAIALACSIFVFIIIRTFPTQILSIFSSDPAMLEVGANYMQNFSIDYLIVPFVFGLNGLFSGAGSTTFTSMNNVSTAILVRAPLAWLLSIHFNMGIPGIALAVPLTSLAGLLLSTIFFFSKKWMNKQIIT